MIDGVSAGGDDALGQAWRDRVETLGGLGEDDVTLAVSFPVQADTEPLRALMRAREQPSAWSWDRVIDEDLPPRTYKQLQGTFTVPYWLADGQIGWEGAAPMQAGVAEASLFVHLPASVEGLEGTAPIWVFGHGIFGNPGIYLQDDDDPSAMLALADRAGAVVVATTWRGLTTRDFAVPLGVAQDIATFGVLRDHLMQGLFNTASLVDLLRDGALADDPAWEGVADPQTLRYHGISLGGIEGAVLQAALGEDAMPSVLHVGGGMWSTMLERSTHWTLFEDTLVDSGMVDATDRQLAYAATQLWWDPVDPAVWGPALRGLPLLWQISAGDEQVPNVASWVVARGAQAQQVGPSAVPVPGVLTADAPSTGPALSVFDPGFGSSDDTNRPAEETDAHETPRRWEGAIQQSLVFLDAQDPGVAVAPCGDAPCTSERTGP